ncbi:MAG TPA: Mrp/NBP35 family ATP-binding protein [Thermotogota bacterium]|nr:Mrp/NBP35 family ATP-binding protein [Thermotogota bacterium]HPE42017.1 Mrp/NBP35 family ATP-binding protein [Thermotogota bacterium]
MSTEKEEGYVKHKLLVLSGKGGVGKTTVSVNLAAALALQGYRVGLLDVDIHGPNVAKMLGIEEKTVTASENGKINPHTLFENLKVISLGSFVPKGKPIIWRGPLKNKTIEQFVDDVEWGNLDFLVIDTPPGTGDEHLGIMQALGTIDGAILVTTPQTVSKDDAKRAGEFVKQMESRILGIVENMSYFVCPTCQTVHHLFGENGGELLADELETVVLIKLPQDPMMITSGDEGKPIPFFFRETPMEKQFLTLSEKILTLVGEGSREA